jgi:hypothetical protein
LFVCCCFVLFCFGFGHNANEEVGEEDLDLAHIFVI